MAERSLWEREAAGSNPATPMSQLGKMGEVSVYMVVLSKALEARARGNEALEDALLDELDGIWLSLTDEDRLRVSEEVKRLNRSQS